MNATAAASERIVDCPKARRKPAARYNSAVVLSGRHRFLPPAQSRPMSSHMTPEEIVSELDKHIVGQEAAKRAVAIALRNRWRRQQVPEPLRQEITPKNILMIGPTGVGKTEIARRLARLADAPFVKVEATKFTEVGYVGPRRRHDHSRPRRSRHQADARSRDAQGSRPRRRRRRGAPARRAAAAGAAKSASPT